MTRDRVTSLQMETEVAHRVIDPQTRGDNRRNSTSRVQYDPIPTCSYVHRENATVGQG